MLKPFLSVIAFLFLFVTTQYAQPTNPVLFTVNGQPVPVSEFVGIYQKSNQDKADFSRASLEEYLDLYTKFKLKVQRARDMGLDTLSNIKTELDGYRRTLANSFLIDREVTEKLTREAYNNMLQDVEISHIFVEIKKNAALKDTLAAFQKIQDAYKAIQSGKSFEQAAAEFSDDKSAAENKGYIGFVSAMLPDGYYAMEQAIYRAKPGDITKPVRTNSGYHIVKVHGSRPARGEMEAAHILFRIPTDASADVVAKTKMRADSAWQALQQGADWLVLCAAVSEDKMTASGKGGNIGFFGINRYQKDFENAAFALEKDGDYTQPVRTTIGWHIVKRLSRKPMGAYETMSRGLVERVKRDSRSELAKQGIIRRIQKDANFVEYPDVLKKWAATQVDSVFHTFKWKSDPNTPQSVLFKLGNNTYTLTQFEEHCSRASRERLRGKGYPVEETVDRLYKSWQDELTLRFEEGNLDKKYPEFTALMREYEGGTLLFEAQKIAVWDKANTDSVGLQQYFDKYLTKKFMYDERARLSTYTLKTDDPAILIKVREYAAKNKREDVLKKFNKKEEILTVIEEIKEKGRDKDLENIWKAGQLNAGKTDAGTKTAYFSKIEEIIPPTPKKLNEAKGFAVAEYQDYLEKEWVKELKNAYKVEINQSVFESLIKK